MKTTTRDVFDRLSKRQDTEHKQALIRLGIVAAALLYISWTNDFTLQNLQRGDFILQTTALLSAAFSLTLLYHIILRPEVNLIRRAVGMAHDVTAVTVCFYYGDAIAALFLFVYPFTAIGNGFRYGEKWLLFSALMGSAGLAVLLGMSEFWKSVPMISTGLAINFLTVVTYTGLLLRKLRATTAKLEELATHDALTGLPNRHNLMERLRQTLTSPKSDSLTQKSKNDGFVSCLYFDLDGFKKVNDTLGHGVGDLLLKEVSRRTRDILRDSDMLARLGGDEFTIVLGNISSRADVDGICMRVIRTIEGIKNIDGHNIAVSVSVGCVIISHHALSIVTSVSEDAVLRHADECMYASKKAGKGRYTVTEPWTPVARAA